jgi:hypothetical protein
MSRLRVGLVSDTLNALTPNTLPPNWTRTIPVLPLRCARGLRRCSPWPASASTVAWQSP